ncbi:hypothetical protein KJ359_009815 [Pestalotiopsis sp. 9143b]|nr:hypothetical protein KJ359_009815 [Pestalotiopsis sp. 9143b]
MMQHFRSSPDLEVGTAHNQGDIEKLVMDRMSKSEWAVREMNPEVRRIVVQLFRNKSGGMFQWATLHINELLTFESNQAILEWLHSLPEGLKAAYDRIYESIGERWRSYANRVFMWLMVSNLTIEPETLCILACQDVNKKFNPNAKLSRGSLLYIVAIV